MPQLRPGLRGLRPSQSMGQAGALNDSQLRLGSGSSPSFSHINMSASVQRVYAAIYTILQSYYCWSFPLAIGLV